MPVNPAILTYHCVDNFQNIFTISLFSSQTIQSMFLLFCCSAAICSSVAPNAFNASTVSSITSPCTQYFATSLSFFQKLLSCFRHKQQLLLGQYNDFPLLLLNYHHQKAHHYLPRLLYLTNQQEQF